MPRPNRKTAADDKTRNRRKNAAKNENEQPAGRNLYLDDKGRLVYYSRLLKKAVYVPKFDYKKFQRFRLRYVIAIASFMVLYTIMGAWFNTPGWIPVLIAVLIWAGMEYSFVKFLKGLQPVKKFRPEELTKTFDLAYTPDMKSKCIIKIVLYFALGILIVVNAYEQQYAAWLIAFCWLAMVFCLYQGGSLAWELYRSIKSQKEQEAAAANKKSMLNKPKARRS